MTEKTLDFLKKLFFNMVSVDFNSLTAPFADISPIDRRFRTGMKSSEKAYDKFREVCKQAEYGTFYLITDPFLIRYILFRPDKNSPDLISVGPYTGTVTDDKYFSEITKMNSLNFSTLEQIKDFLCNLPVLDDNLMLVASLNSVIEYIDSQAPIFQLEYLNYDTTNNEGDSILLLDNFDEQIRNTEARYQAEAELLDCISRGDSANCAYALRKFRSYTFSPRIPDVIREKKSLSYTANAMYRKAAQLGDVHPYHLHRLSSHYAKAIEQCSTVSQIEQLAEKMVRDYCLLVKNKSVKHYSPVIRQVVNYIEFHISSPLSLREIADQMNISPPYLSSLFKKELGIPLTAYINQQRISKALKLLVSTDMQVQNIAMHVGIVDVNYFIKIFKKQIGCTPRDYRKQLR